MDNLTALNQFASTLGKQFPDYQEGIKSFLTSLEPQTSFTIKDINLTIVDDKLFIWDFIIKLNDVQGEQDAFNMVWDDNPEFPAFIISIPPFNEYKRLTLYAQA